MFDRCACPCRTSGFAREKKFGSFHNPAYICTRQGNDYGSLMCIGQMESAVSIAQDTIYRIVLGLYRCDLELYSQACRTETTLSRQLGNSLI